MRYSSVVLFTALLFLGCEASPSFPKLGRDDASSGILGIYATGTGTVGLNPTSATKPMPTNTPLLSCAGSNNDYWTPLDDATQAIKDFCGQPDLNTHDTNSGSRSRTYNKNTLTEIIITIDWPQGPDIELNEDDCIKHMTMLLDDCDGNNPQNPLNWKHGGKLSVGPIVYHVLPNAERYFAGQCTANVTETVYEIPSLLAGTYEYVFNISVSMFSGRRWGSGENSRSIHDFFSNYTLSGDYYAPLSISPAFVGTNFHKQDNNVEFRIGDQVWSKNDTQRYVLIDAGPPDSNTTKFSLSFDC